MIYQRKDKDKMTEQIFDADLKKAAAGNILDSLTEWFEVEESRKKYIEESAGQVFIAAKRDGRYAGFLCLKETGNATAEIAVMGVLKEYHRSGIGRALFEAAKTAAKDAGYSFLQVKTVKKGVYEDYDKTNLFYISCGFREFEVIDSLWGEENPCQIYVMYIGG